MRCLLWLIPWAVIPSGLALEIPTTLELDQDIHMLEQTIAFDAPPVDVSVRGMYCKRSALHDDPVEDDKPWAHGIRMTLDVINSLVTSRNAAKAESDAERRLVMLRIARDRLFEFRRMMDVVDPVGEDAVVIDTLKATDQFEPVVLDPVPGSFQEVYFFECLTAEEYRVASASIRKVLQAMRASLRTPVTLSAPLPPGVTLHARVHRQWRELLQVVPPEPAPGPISDKGRSVSQPGADANREFEFPAEIREALAARPQLLPVRRRESYLAPSPPLSDYDSPGACGVCRRDAMKACFLDTCSNLARESMAMRNGTIGLVTTLNELQAKYAASNSEATQRFLSDQWHTSKRELDIRDEAIRLQVEKEDLGLAQCEKACQLTSHSKCQGGCSKAMVGDRHLVPLQPARCRSLSAGDVYRTRHSHDVFMEALGVTAAAAKAFSVHDYFVWQASLETDPSKLADRAGDPSAGISQRDVTKTIGSASLRVPVEPWFEPDPGAAQGDCCSWQKVSAVAVRQADLSLNGREWTYDFDIQFDELASLAGPANAYFRPFRSSSGNGRPVAAVEILARLTADVLGMQRARVGALASAAVRALILPAGTVGQVVTAAEAGRWNIGWGDASFFGHMMEVRFREQSARDTFEKLVSRDNFSAQGIEDLAGREGYRMRVRGTYFWPEEICETPTLAYNEVTDVSDGGRHLCAAPQRRVRQLNQMGETSSCSINQAAPMQGLDGCWIYDGKSPSEVIIRTDGDRVTADVAYQNRRYAGLVHNNKVLLRYDAVSPRDRAAMPWVTRAGEPVTIPAAVIGQAWGDARSTRFVLQASSLQAPDLLTGSYHGVWLDHDEKGKLTGTSPLHAQVKWSRKPLVDGYARLTGPESIMEAEDLSASMPSTVRVLMEFDSHCRTLTEKTTVQLKLTDQKGNSVVVPIELIEPEPEAGYAISSPTGTSIPEGTWVKREFLGSGESREYRLPSGAPQSEAPRPAERAPESAMSPEEFLKSLDDRLKKKD
ncbi:MAG: hypothetical protein O2868_14420 [Proteobacteria bacterium]|nr:hypothetical protein [Pseudomonadota bacterium]